MFDKLRKMMTKVLDTPARGSGRSKGNPRQFRPGLETLEERALMAVMGEFHINTRTFLDQDHVAVASQPVNNGRTIVTWQDQFNQEGSDIDIKAQIYDGAGNKVGGEITVAGSIFKETEPAVAVDAQGNFVVVWTEAVNGTTNTDIRAQRFFANGARNGGEVFVTGDARREFDPDVAMDSAGNFVVSYTLAFSTTDVDVMARRFDSTGAFLGTITVAGSGLNEHSSSIARTPDGRFSIGYEVDKSVTGFFVDSDIRLNRYSAGGTLLGVNEIANSPRGEFGPDVAMDRGGNTVVVYQYVFANLDHDILARKVSNNGVMGGTIFVDASADFEFSPTVAMNQTNGDFVVAYQKLHNNGTILVGPNSLIVREMSSAGAIKSTTNLGDYSAPALAINSSDVYFLAYSGIGKPGDTGSGIFGRRGTLSSTSAVRSSTALAHVGPAAAPMTSDSDLFFLAYSDLDKPGDSGPGVFGRRGRMW